MSSLKDSVSDAIPDSAKVYYNRFSWLMPWIVGSVLGLALGLIIGWVIWPVQWTNAVVTDLSRGERAAYISAVADAYVLDGTGYAEVNMYTRLDAFGDKLPDEVLGAIEYYRADPNTDQVQLANLARLATDIGIPVDATAMNTSSPAPALAPVLGIAPVTNQGQVTEATGALASAPPATSNQESNGIWTWLLAILVAGGLIGGGLYLLRYLNKSTQPSENLTEAPPAAMPGEMRSPHQVPVGGAEKRSSLWKSSPPKSAKSPDDLSFDDEDEDEEPAVRFGNGEDDDEYGDYDDEDPVNDARYSAPVPVGFAQPAPTGGISPYNGPSYSGSTYGTQGGATVKSNAPAGTPVAAGYGAATAEALKPEPVPVRTAPQRRPEAAVVAPAPARKVIASYTCHYQAGLPDYIEAHNITDAATGRYIGECGMGVSSKNRALHSNPDQVIALEVWMYDKLDPRDNVNNTRVLLSEFAADRDYAQAFSRERDGSTKAFLAEPGTRFQLEGRNLILEGEIVAADYDRDGIFTGAKVILNVLARK